MLLKLSRVNFCFVLIIQHKQLTCFQARSRLQTSDRESRDRGSEQSGEELVQRDPQMVGRKNRTPGHRRRQQERHRQAAVLIHEHLRKKAGQPSPGN